MSDKINEKPEPDLDPDRKVSPEMMLGFLIHEYPTYVEEVNAVVFDSTRRKQKGKLYNYAEVPATITMAVPDEVVVNMRGEEDKKHWYVLMRVDREALDMLKDKAENPSRIIVPPTVVT